MKWHRLVALAVIVLPLLALGAWLFAGHDENYALQKLFFRSRYDRFDEWIAQAANRYRVSPSLVKAVIWRESRFQPGMLGAHGETGLMQITERAAQDWARAEKVETFVTSDLLDPKTNIEAGTWYLANALRRWSGKDDPVPFALAEYNAGRTRVIRWEKTSGLGGGFRAEDLHGIMDFPATRSYIRSIVDRYLDFKKKGEFPGEGAVPRQVPERPAGGRSSPPSSAFDIAPAAQVPQREREPDPGQQAGLRFGDGGDTEIVYRKPRVGSTSVVAIPSQVNPGVVGQIQARNGIRKMSCNSPLGACCNADGWGIV